MSTETKFEDGKLTVTRTYSAPREAVFEAWVETSKVQRWWGCAQTRTVRSEIECKVGGKYNHHMTLEGGHEIPGGAVFTVFDPPAQLAFQSEMPGGPPMTVTVTFTAVDAGTRVQLVHEGIPDIEVDGGMKMREIVSGGWTAAFGKLADFLSAAV